MPGTQSCRTGLRCPNGLVRRTRTQLGGSTSNVNRPWPTLTKQLLQEDVIELREIAGRMGCDIVKVYKDHGISGAKGRDKRPQFDALCKAATRREFEMVMAWSVDRLGRSLQDLVAFLGELHSLKIDLYLHQQGIDTTTPAGKAMFQMMEVFAEFERAMIQERVRAGLARAKAEGKQLGRPPIPDKLVGRIKEARAGGLSVRETAARLDVSPTTVQRISTSPFASAVGG
jgi:DNA invertase Pin-like site-specific DNA recombinase